MENISLYSSIELLIQHIEDNIEKNLSLEELSEHCCISKFHLIRVFKNLTNITVMDYVRSRKLASSLKDLLNTDMKIIDIALKYNFEYEQTYIRAFKNEYGITPSKFRKQHKTVNIVEKINLDLCKDFERGILFSPKFVVKPEFKVIGIKDIVPIEENTTKNLANNRGVDFFLKHSYRIKNAINPNVYIGLTRLVSNDADYTYYMPSIQVSSSADIPEGMCHDTIKGSKYAVFNYIGNHPAQELSKVTMKALYEYIYERWIPSLGYDFMEAGGFRFEEIDSKVSTSDYCEAKLYLPLKL
jgi:AraC family transcriptional regulator